MKLRLAFITFAASCCLLTSLMTRPCLAQRHPSRTVKDSELPPLPTGVRLVQATEEDLSDVLNTARDLLESMDADASTNGDLDLDALTQPQQNEAAEGPTLPRTLDEYRGAQSSVEDDQPSLQGAADLNLEARTAEDEAWQDAASDRYRDVVPHVDNRSRRSRAHIPYTLGDILQDEDEINPCCEQEFCRRMWACAGGRNQMWLDRVKRDMWRERMVMRSGNARCLRSPFSEPFVCPSCQQAHYDHAHPTGAGYPEYFRDSPSDRRVESEIIIGPTEEFPAKPIPASEDTVDLGPIPNESVPGRNASNRR